MDPPIYERAPDGGKCLYQGELLSGVVRFRLDPEKLGDAEPSVQRVDYPFVLVLSQACDLAQDFHLRQEGKSPQLPDVLFCHAPTAAELKGASGMNSSIWDRIKKNKDERYHFLERVPPDCDAYDEELPELGVDFKRYFTIPTDEVYWRIERKEIRRRVKLCTPYLEHLSSRFAYFLSRIGLPRDHISD